MIVENITMVLPYIFREINLAIFQMVVIFSLGKVFQGCWSHVISLRAENAITSILNETKKIVNIFFNVLTGSICKKTVVS